MTSENISNVRNGGILKTTFFVVLHLHATQLTTSSQTESPGQKRSNGIPFKQVTYPLHVKHD